MEIRGFIFDLDGVIVDTAHFHALCWSEMAASIGIGLTKEQLDGMRGVGRMDALEIILKNSDRLYTQDEKISLATAKNESYLQMVQSLKPEDALEGVVQFLDFSKEMGLKISLGSSSKNAKLVLAKLNLMEYFDAICDGTDITKSKPDPQIFLLACSKLKLNPAECIVFEDAEEGINAAISAGCNVVGVGNSQIDYLKKARTIIENFQPIHPKEIMNIFISNNSE